MPIWITLILTKSAMLLSRATGRGRGAALPGLIAEKLDLSVGRKISATLSGGVVLVTGTNGKTTTTKMIVDMLEARGEKVLANRTGSNLRRGILSALIAAADIWGRTGKTVAVFEVDEASLRLVAADLQPRAIVVTNLFRDQLDRYGELDTTAALIGQGIGQTAAKLFLNADDPLVASLARYSTTGEVEYFGVEKVPAANMSKITVSDSNRCPICNEKLRFSRVFYSHIGHYDCPNNDFQRSRPTVSVRSVMEMDIDGSLFSMAIHNEGCEVRLPLPGIYNLYNALAAAALGSGMGISADEIIDSLSATAAAFGRVEIVEYLDRRLYLLLVKNPAGFTQTIETFVASRSDSAIMIAINDNYADGRDVSWLWDVPFELMTTSRPRIVVSGVRADDMALRLKYAEIGCTVKNDLEGALNQLVENSAPGEPVFVMPTYTAMLEVREILAREAKISEVNQ